MENYFEKFILRLDRKEGKDSEGFTYEEMQKAWNGSIDAIFDVFWQHIRDDDFQDKMGDLIRSVRAK